MDDEQRIDLYRELYRVEFDHRNAINGGLTVAFAVVSAVAAGLMYLYARLPESDGTLRAWFIGFLIAAALAWLVAVILFLFAWWGYKYSHLRSPEEIEGYRQDIEDYNLKAGAGTAIDPDREIERLVLDGFVGAVSNNRRSNRAKSNAASLGKVSSAVAMVALLVGFVIAEVDNHQPREGPDGGQGIQAQQAGATEAAAADRGVPRGGAAVEAPAASTSP